MTTVIAQRERALYEDVWHSLAGYQAFSPGEKRIDVFLDMAGLAVDVEGRVRQPATVLDAGCGSGKGALALAARGFLVDLVDLTDVGLVPEAERFRFVAGALWDDLQHLTGSRYAYVYCCDVLEHIPTALTMLVVARLLAVAQRGVFLNIGLAQDNFGAWMGQPLHKTMESYVVWRDLLACVGHLVEARDLLTSCAFYLEPK